MRNESFIYSTLIYILISFSHFILPQLKKDDKRIHRCEHKFVSQFEFAAVMLERVIRETTNLVPDCCKYKGEEMKEEQAFERTSLFRVSFHTPYSIASAFCFYDCQFFYFSSCCDFVQIRKLSARMFRHFLVRDRLYASS